MNYKKLIVGAECARNQSAGQQPTVALKIINLIMEKDREAMLPVQLLAGGPTTRE